MKRIVYTLISKQRHFFLNMMELLKLLFLSLIPIVTLGFNLVTALAAVWIFYEIRVLFIRDSICYIEATEDSLDFCYYDCFIRRYGSIPFDEMYVGRSLNGKRISINKKKHSLSGKFRCNV
mgnify:CR=1 FL=1